MVRLQQPFLYMTVAKKLVQKNLYKKNGDSLIFVSCHKSITETCVRAFGGVSDSLHLAKVRLSLSRRHSNGVSGPMLLHSIPRHLSQSATSRLYDTVAHTRTHKYSHTQH